jgi:hypothetical protein
VSRAIVLLLSLAACSREADPKACEQRIAALEQRLAGLAAPTPTEQWVTGYAIPRVPRERTQPIGADGIVVMSRYAEGAMWMRGFGEFAGVHGKPDAGHVEVDVVKELQRARAASGAPTIAVYVVVPQPDHPMIHLVDMLASADPSFDLRLVVGIEESRTEPAPSDASASVRKTLATLAPPNQHEYGKAVQSLIDKAARKCDGLPRTLIEAIVGDQAPNVAPVLAATRQCGCSKVHVPTLEAVLVALAFNVGRPKLAWLPLDLAVSSGTVQELASSGGPALPPAEAALGVPCTAASDCRAPATACVSFDADGTWYPGRPSSCTRPCGDGCPKGFRCTREVAITGADASGIQHRIVSTWCGPIAAR